MSTQRQHHSKARRDRARVQFQIKPKQLAKCGHCGAMIEKHAVCPKCGHYKNKEVLDTMKKIKKKKAKSQKK